MIHMFFQSTLIDKMKIKTKLGIGGIIGTIILVSLIFIPVNYLGIEPNGVEIPPRVMVLSNQPDDFEITNPSCTKDSEIVQFQFNIANTLDADYRLEIHLTQNDIDGNNLAKQAILVETTAQDTAFESHQMSLESEMDMCVIELILSEKIP